MRPSSGSSCFLWRFLARSCSAGGVPRCLLLVLVVVVPFPLFGPTFVYALGNSEEVMNGAVKFFWLYPVALAVGTLVSRFTARARLAGVVLLVAPFVFVVWAGVRH